MRGRPKYIDYTNKVLATLSEIPLKEWGKVLYLVNKYYEYLIEEGYLHKEGRTKHKGRTK